MPQEASQGIERKNNGGQHVFHPFDQGDFLSRRVREGNFGPTASHDRSPALQERFKQSLLPRINEYIHKYTDLLFWEKSPNKYENKKNPKDLPDDIPKIKTKLGEKEWTKENEFNRLEEEWKEISTSKKSDEKELAWVEHAVALTVAGFEEYQHKKGNTNFKIRENQIYHMVSLILNRGKYEFADFETDKRGVELPTGEGKTFGFGLAAPIFALQGGSVVVMEPSYVSAQSHAAQMADFYESFCRQTTGTLVSVPEKEGYAPKIVPNGHGVFGISIVQTGGYKSYRHIGSKMVEDMGVEGRKKAWSQRIIYTDSDAFAFDWLSDHQIGTQSKSGQPPLSEITVMIAEADDLMLDRARNAYITSEVSKEGKAWDRIGEVAGLNDLYPKDWSEQDRRATTTRAMFNLWSDLYEAKKRGHFKQGFGEDYMVINRRFIDSERLSFKAKNIAAQSLSSIFGYDEFQEEEKAGRLIRSWGGLAIDEKKGWDVAIESVRKAYRFSTKESEEKLRKIFERNPPGNILSSEIIEALRQDHQTLVWETVSDIINPTDILLGDDVYLYSRKMEEINERFNFLTPANKEALTGLIQWIGQHDVVIDSALYSLFGLQAQTDFIGKDRPVLLDDYGFPLEKRQLHDAQQIFLQLNHIWQNEHMSEKQIDPTLFMDLEKKYAQTIEASYTSNRITLPVLLENCKRVRFSSGSLIPAATSFSELYGAEVIAASRHLPIPEKFPPEKKTSIITECLDGGLAQVDFLESNTARIQELQERAKTIQKAGRVGLFIVPDIHMAEELQKTIPGSQIATGAEELQERGTLDKITSIGEPGKIIITTWIAHRDIDVKMTHDALDNGGLDCVVSGIPPTERGLWQALQRALRGDQPGTRSLLLAKEDFIPLQNIDVLSGPVANLWHRPIDKTHRELVREIDEQWKQVLKGDRRAMQHLFADYLDYLRGKEGIMQQQLVNIMIRDSDLEHWQELYVNGFGNKIQQTTDYVNNAKMEAEKKLNELGGIPPSIQTTTSQSKPNTRTNTVLARLESHFGYHVEREEYLPQTIKQVKQEDLREGWGDFLRILELESYLFLSNPDIQKLSLELQRSEFKTHIESLLRQQGE